MNGEARLVLGERLFVLATMTVLAAEAVLTVVATGLSFSWPRLVLGSVSFVLVLLLANQLYSGDKHTWRQTWQLALGWAALQLLLLIPAAVLGPTHRPGFLGFLQELGMPFPWMTACKAIAYLFFVAVLVAPENVRQFFAHKRGEEIAFRDRPVDTSEAITWTPAQSQAFAGLASALQVAGGLLLLVGVLQLAVANRGPQGPIPPAVEGVLTLALAVLLLMPSVAVKALAAPESSMGRLMAALTQLKWLHLGGLLVAVVMVALVVVRLVSLLS